MTTGLSSASFANMQLNAGVFLINFDYASATDSTTLAALIATALEEGTDVLGATTGGGTFVATPTVRQIEADGSRNAFKGSEVFDAWDIKLTTTLKEITPANLQRTLAAAQITTSENITTIAINNDLATTDYIDSLVWVGDIADGSLVLIDLKNALNTAGSTLTFQDKGEGTIPVEFTAHQDAVNSTTAPVTIKYFKKAVGG